jgi:hypothetical protein
MKLVISCQGSGSSNKVSIFGYGGQYSRVATAGHPNDFELLLSFKSQVR